MILKYLLLSLVLFSSLSSTLLARKTEDKLLQTIDRTYEKNIKSVLLHPYTANLKDPLLPAVISINEERELLLSFDEMGEESSNFYVQILHCNSDWSLSNLNSILFLPDYNEYQLLDKQPSYNTRIPYIRYRFFLPKTKISGNFLVVVYKDGDINNLILTKRFMVYENNVTITPQVKFPISSSERNTGQQADFSLSYNQSIQNPMERMSVVVRQNNNWVNALKDLKPVFMRDDIHTYDYTFFNNENVFKGGNEFRFFDLRTLNSNGMNVSNINSTSSSNEVLLSYDKSRAGNAYSTSYDINGCYLPEQYETKGFETEPDYANVTFTLEIKKEAVPGRVFIMGALSDWSLNATFEMKWDTEYNVYTCATLLKQGYYDYSYVVLPSNTSQEDSNLLEGTFSQTQNVYDFIVYYRGPGGLSDRIVGYKSVNYLSR